MSSPKMPVSRALAWILVSTILISGSCTVAWVSYSHVRMIRTINPTYNIVSIVQTGPEREALKTVYLAQLMGLSVDCPTNLYNFRAEQAEKQLLSSPVITNARVKKNYPGTIYIDYTARYPVASLYDYANTALDDDGCIFPIKPFFTPKKLPEIYFGLPPFGLKVSKEGSDAANEPGGEWNVPLKGKKLQLALSLLRLFSSPMYRDSFHVTRIDVSSAYLESCGGRQVILTVEDRVFRMCEGKSVLYVYPRVLRLTTRHYLRELGNYLRLRGHLLVREEKISSPPAEGKDVVLAAPMTIDFRVPQVAFIKY